MQNNNSISLGKLQYASDEMIKQEPVVKEDGIYVPVHEYAPKGCSSAYRLLITKEVFIEAYNKFIKQSE